MKVRIYYRKAGIRETVLEADTRTLSDDTLTFLKFIKDHTTPDHSDPYMKMYLLEVEVWK